MDNFHIPTFRERENQIFDGYRQALKIKGQYKKTCVRCGRVGIPMEAFFPHKAMGQPPYCPTCNFLKEVHDHLRIESLVTNIDLEKSHH